MLSGKMLQELTDSRFRGEEDVHFLARYCRQKIVRWIDADAELLTAKKDGVGEGALKRLEADARHAKFFLTGAVDLLNEQLTKDSAPNGALRIEP